MNAYIIFAGTISHLGGGQLYINRKCKYLREMGWKALIICDDNTDILIKELNDYPNLMKQETSCPVYYYSKKNRGKVISSIIQWINTQTHRDEVKCIESLGICPATWAESIARHYGIPNIIYCIAEFYFSRLQSLLKQYVLFKIKNGQFIAITNKSRDIIFGDGDYNGLDIPYVNVPFSTSELAHNNCDELYMLEKYKDNSFIVLTVSRLEKAYIVTLINEIIKLSENCSKKIVLVIVGDSSKKGLLKEYRTRYDMDDDKLKIIFTGYINPLPKRLFKIADIFTGMGTAAVNAISQGCPAICVDPRSSSSAGILGLDIDNFAFNDIKNLKPISFDINRLMNDKALLYRASEAGRKLFEEEFECESVMNKFMDIVNEQLTKKNIEYFSFINDFNYLRGVKAIILNLFGIKFYKYISYIYGETISLLKKLCKLCH